MKQIPYNHSTIIMLLILFQIELEADAIEHSDDKWTTSYETAKMINLSPQHCLRLLKLLSNESLANHRIVTMGNGVGKNQFCLSESGLKWIHQNDSLCNANKRQFLKKKRGLVCLTTSL